VRELQKHAMPGCVISLVGNKCDLEEARQARRTALAAAPKVPRCAELAPRRRSPLGCDARATPAVR
jgi:hypothetical protein